MASGFVPKCPGCGGQMNYLFDEVYFCDNCDIIVDVDSNGITIPRDQHTGKWLPGWKEP